MNANTKVHEIEKILMSKGYKLTRSRKELVRIFVESKEHLQPEDIYYNSKAMKISIPTIYRNIDIFKKTNIIKEITINNARYYELDIYSKKKLHIHFQCYQCGVIKEYKDQQLVREMIDQRDFIEKNYHDSIDDITIVMKGTCRECHEKDQVIDNGKTKKI
ncbi:MAG: transcriptional repressor [Vallitaleaceae bacterium]|nr:transcriptional repressor [Vallitaleaceae bacterium]